MSRLLWFLIGSAATLVAGAVVANCMDDDYESVGGQGHNTFFSERGDQEISDDGEPIEA